MAEKLEQIRNRFDRQSKPLRDAFGEWARQHGFGWGGGWDRQREMWRYETFSPAPWLHVEVLEDGSAALAWSVPTAVKSMATTPRGLRRVLNRLAGER